MMEDIQNWNWWEHKGHPRGQHILSPCGQLAIVCIPKCSSSYWRSWLEGERGWIVKHNEHMEKNVHCICLLRDPVKRWIAGISEYFNTYFTSDEDMKCESTLKLFRTGLCLTITQKYNSISIHLLIITALLSSDMTIHTVYGKK